MMESCVTVSYGKVKGKARKHPYFQTVVYHKAQLKKDGSAVWWYGTHVGKARRSYEKAVRDALVYAQVNNIPYLAGIRHLKKVSGSEP